MRVYHSTDIRAATVQRQVHRGLTRRSPGAEQDLSLEIDQEQVRWLQEPLVVSCRRNPQALWCLQRADIPLRTSDEATLVQTLTNRYDVPTNQVGVGRHTASSATVSAEGCFSSPWRDCVGAGPSGPSSILDALETEC